MLKPQILPSSSTAAARPRRPYVNASTVLTLATVAVSIAFAAVGNILFMFVGLNVYSPFIAEQWDADFRGDWTVKLYTLAAKSWGLVSCRAHEYFPNNNTSGAGPGFAYELRRSPFDEELYAQYTWSPSMPVAWAVNWVFVMYCVAVFHKFNKPIVLLDYASKEVVGVVKMSRPASWLKALALTLAHATVLNEYLFLAFYFLYLLIAYQMENMRCTGLYGAIVANIYRCGGCASLSTWFLVRLAYRGGWMGTRRPVLVQKSRGLVVYFVLYAWLAVLIVGLHVTGALGAGSWVKCTVGYAIMIKLGEWLMNLGTGFQYRRGQTYIEDLVHRLHLNCLSYMISCAEDQFGNQTSCILGGLINVELLGAIKNPWIGLPTSTANAKFNELRVALHPSNQPFGSAKHNPLDPGKPEVVVVLPLTQSDVFMKDTSFNEYFGLGLRRAYEFGSRTNPHNATMSTRLRGTESRTL